MLPTTIATIISVHISAVLEEELYHSRVAILGCRQQRRFSNSVYVCTVLDEELHDVRVPAPRCQAQGLIFTSASIRAAPQLCGHSEMPKLTPG